MWYVRSADRLERTAAWQRKLPGGIDQVKRVVMHDALGIAADLEADMERHVAAYECEWAATLADEDRLARFRSVVNDPTPSPLPPRVEIRGQRVPACAPPGWPSRRSSRPPPGPAGCGGG